MKLNTEESRKIYLKHKFLFCDQYILCYLILMMFSHFDINMVLCLQATLYNLVNLTFCVLNLFFYSVSTQICCYLLSFYRKQ